MVLYPCALSELAVAAESLRTYRVSRMMSVRLNCRGNYLPRSFDSDGDSVDRLMTSTLSK